MKKIIIKPVITEKSLFLAQNSKFTFKVDKLAVKGTIAKAVSELYGVTVTDVSVISMHGKAHRAGKKQVKIILPNWKKAIVTLKKGQSIAAFEIKSDESEKNK
jgi:large subunit ribosomal protein L23